MAASPEQLAVRAEAQKYGGSVWPNKCGFDVSAEVGQFGCEAGVWECYRGWVAGLWFVKLIAEGERVAFATGRGPTAEAAMAGAELTEAGLRAAGLEE